MSLTAPLRGTRRPRGGGGTSGRPIFTPMRSARCDFVASQVEFFGEPRWRAAVAGDAASAIGVALSMNPKGPFRQKFDLAMTALAACACEGSAAACVVVGNVILNLPRASDEESDLADAWARLASTTLRQSMRSLK